MTASLSKLKTELAKPDYTLMADPDVAAAFRVPGSGGNILHDISVGELERYLASEEGDILLALRDEALTGGSNNPVATATARKLVALIDSPNVDAFDIHHTSAAMGLSALESVNIISDVQHAAITKLGTTQQTIWQEIGIPNGTADDVMRARTL